MSDFFKAIESGIKAANDAAANVTEIHQVLAELGAQLEEFSEGRLKLIKGTKEVSPDDSSTYNPFTSSIVGNAINAFKIKTPKNCLCIKLDGEETLHDISFYEISKTGYPISLSFSGKSITCYDKQGLEDALRELFSHPDTGKIINRLIAKAQKLSAENENSLPPEVN